MKIIAYWDGSKMSWLRYMTLKSCRHYNPDAEILLHHNNTVLGQEQTWEEHNQQDFATYCGEDYVDRLAEIGVSYLEWKPDVPEGEYNKIMSMCPSHRSNLFKWYELATSAATYIDMDILFIRPFDNILSRCNISICYKEWFSIGLLASNMPNTIFMDFYRSALINHQVSKYQCCGVEALYRSLYGEKWYEKVYKTDMFNDLVAKYPVYSIYNIPMDYVYYRDFKQLDDLFIDSVNFPADAIGIYWYAGNPLSQEWNNKLTESNYTKYNSTICNYIRKIM